MLVFPKSRYWSFKSKLAFKSNTINNCLFILQKGGEKMEYLRHTEEGAREIGRQEGRREGRKEGRQEGRQEGHQEGRQEGPKGRATECHFEYVEGQNGHYSHC